jgi:hypothetical protein
METALAALLLVEWDHANAYRLHSVDGFGYSECVGDLSVRKFILLMSNADIVQERRIAQDICKHDRTAVTARLQLL